MKRKIITTLLIATVAITSYTCSQGKSEEKCCNRQRLQRKQMEIPGLRRLYEG